MAYRRASPSTNDTDLNSSWPARPPLVVGYGPNSEVAVPLFDPSTVPREVCSPAGVADVNALVEALRAQRVERIDMQESPRGFRVSNKARTYCQGQLWRCLDLVEGAETLRLAGHELGTMLMVRAIYETIAAFVHFERRFASTMRPLEAEEDLKRHL